MKITSLLALGLIAAALIVTAGCATSKPKSTASLLTEAGFKTVSATTPQQHQQLETLTAGQVSPVKRNGQIYYVYPERAQQQLFVGQETEYRKYQKLVREQMAAMDARLKRASEAENAAVDRAMSDRDSTPGFEGPGGFDF
jgi:hypothetical protein